MSLPPRILCRAGCGDFGDPELDHLCVDCHGDRVEAQRERELQDYIRQKEQTASNTADSSPASKTRRGPLSINHQKALQEFLDRPREKDANVIVRENQFLERELQIRETSKAQLRKYMVATDGDEPVDPKEWSRYTYGGPRDVPRHDVDEATEYAAQIKLFCYWRKRTLRQRIESKRQLFQAEKQQSSKTQGSHFGKTARELFATNTTSTMPQRAAMTSLQEKSAAKVKQMHKEAKKRASLLVAAWPKKTN